MIPITQSRHHQGRSRAQIALPPRALRHSTLPSRVCLSFLKMVSMATLFVGLHLLLSVLLTLKYWLSQDHLAWFWPIGFVACIALALALYVSVHMLVRRRFRFSLKRLLIAVTLISFLLSLQVGRWRRAQARHSITALGGTMELGVGNSGLSYAVEDEHEDGNKPFRPQWLRRSLAYVLDNASFDRVVLVSFRDSEINDADLVHLKDLGRISGLQIGHTRIEPEFEDPERVRPPLSEQLSREDLLQGYTINGARQLNLDADTGSIQVGKWADLIVLNKNLFEVKSNEIRYVMPTAVLMEGELVHGKLG
jgi:hypothetical protein